ncbi:hypothetical protein HGRIS_002910 [Hohenbuehelia grisea]|uniref:F-box domain-containing protein n=1 Tax=Hohenbuehelia grisea TaxID=104357 RepID=A0ABR3JM29_9AGAR
MATESSRDQREDDDQTEVAPTKKLENGVNGSRHSDTALTLQKRIQQLREENAILWQRLQDCQRRNGEHVQRLPHEILRIILQYSIPPDFLLDHSLTGGPRSPWCLAMSQKRAIVSVCKDWNQVGVEFLYDHVVLRRMLQCEAFLNILREGSPRSLNLAGLVTKLTLHCFVPPAATGRFNFGLFTIFENCPRISRVSITLPHVMCWDVKLYWTSKITHLELGRDVDLFAQPKCLAAVAEHLVSLAFCLPATPISAPPSASLIFAHLEALRCKTVITTASAPGLRVLAHIEKKWIMPQLQRLEIAWDYPIDIKPELSSRLSQATASLCRAHGSHLHTLSVHPILPYPKIATGSVPDGQDIRRILSSCPALEHLVLSAKPEVKLAHAKLKWIDIWSVDVANPDRSASLKIEIGKKSLPSLQRVRILDYALCTLPEVAMTLSPELFSTDVAYRYEYPGVAVQYANQVLQRMDAIRCAQLPSKAFNRWMWNLEGTSDEEADDDVEGDSSDDEDAWSGSSRWSDDTREFPSGYGSEDEKWLQRLGIYNC